MSDWLWSVCVFGLPTLCLTLQINSVLLTWTLWVLRQKLCSVSSEVSKLKDTRCSLFLTFAPFFLLLTEPHQSLFCIYHVPMQVHACYGTHVGVKGHLGIFSILFEIELFIVHHCVCWDIWLNPPVCSSLLNTGAWGLQITHFALDFMWVLRI